MIFTTVRCTTFKFDIAVLGASGNLGRELVYQSIVNSNANVLDTIGTRMAHPIPNLGTNQAIADL